VGTVAGVATVRRMKAWKPILSPLAFSRLRRASAVRPRGLPDDVDWGQAWGYIYATLVQFGLISCALKALDFVFCRLHWDALAKINLLGLGGAALPGRVKSTTVFLFFLFMAFRSRVFSPLDNSRPTLSSETKEIQERKRPSWCPPPIAFPIIWTTIGILRAASSLIVWNALGGKFLVGPIMIFLGHLCVGDTWNSINNVDKLYGVATLTMVFVVATVCLADYAYFTVSRKAGLVLAPSAVWIVTASFLVFSIWKLNDRPPLYPVKKTSSPP